MSFRAKILLSDHFPLQDLHFNVHLNLNLKLHFAPFSRQNDEKSWISKAQEAHGLCHQWQGKEAAAEGATGDHRHAVAHAHALHRLAQQPFRKEEQ